MRGRRMYAAACAVVGVVGVLGAGPAAFGLGINFDQVSWLASGSGYVNQYSAWGQASVVLDASDLPNLVPDGMGGYFAFVNVATTSGVLTNHWGVQNVVLTVPSLADLGTQVPTVMTFNLGTSGSLTSLSYGVSLSTVPLGAGPAVGGSALVASKDVYFGGVEVTPGSWDNLALSAPVDTFGAAVGGGAGPITPPTATDANVPLVQEDPNGCAPGAAARSLKYLGLVSNAQTTYQTLTSSTYMNTNTGTSGAGTGWANFKAGKDKIAPGVTTWVTSFDDVITALQKKSDVEMWVSWGAGLGGHCAFVTQVVPIKDADGNTTGWQVTYYDDENQADNAASSVKHVITVKNDANHTLSGYGDTSKMWGFYVEVPEPGTLGVLGLGAAALLGRRRKRSG